MALIPESRGWTHNQQQKQPYVVSHQKLEMWFAMPAILKPGYFSSLFSGLFLPIFWLKKKPEKKPETTI
jgi:hypothetical protein